MSDANYMAMALSLARAAADLGETPVGCVIVDEATGEVIAGAANEPIGLKDPTAHAEILALRRAAEVTSNYRLRPNLTLYVTLEPCAMCAGAISNARIARVVYGASDPKSGGVEHGARVWEHAQTHWKPKVTAGVEAEAAATLLKDFFKARRKRDTMSEMQTVYFEDLRVGMRETTRNQVTKENVAAFAEISGDRNPIHLDEGYAASTPFGGCIAHGVFTAGFVSAAIATRLPGPGSIYISQSLSFRAPVMIGATVDTTIEVIELIERGRRVKLKCECRVGDKLVLEGEAEVKATAKPAG